MNVYSSSAPTKRRLVDTRTNSCNVLLLCKQPIYDEPTLPSAFSDDSGNLRTVQLDDEMIKTLEESNSLIKSYQIKSKGKKKRMIQIPKLNLTNLDMSCRTLPIEDLTTRPISAKRIMIAIEKGNHHFTIDFKHNINFVVHRAGCNFYSINKYDGDMHIYTLWLNTYENCAHVRFQRCTNSFKESDLRKYIFRSKFLFRFLSKDKLPKICSFDVFNKADVICNNKIGSIITEYGEISPDAGSCIRGFDIRERNGSLCLTRTRSKKVN